jgi:hypothetical protein
LIVLLAASMFWVNHLQQKASVAPVENVVTGDDEDRVLSVLQEMEKLLLSLSGLLIGAVATLVAKDGELRARPSRFRAAHLFLVLYSASFSMYFGFVVYSGILDLLHQPACFSGTSPILQDPLQSQYYLFLASVVLLILWVVGQWYRRLNHSGGGSQ